MRADATMTANGGLVTKGNAVYMVVEVSDGWYAQAVNALNVRFGPYGSASEAANGVMTADNIAHMGPIPREPALNG